MASNRYIFASDLDLKGLIIAVEKELESRNDRIVGRHEMLEMVGVSYTTIFHSMKKGRFPKSVKLSVNRVGWRYSEIQEFISIGADAWHEKYSQEAA